MANRMISHFLYMMKIYISRVNKVTSTDCNNQRCSLRISYLIEVAA